MVAAGAPRKNEYKIERQDGGLLILTKKEYPIIAASGFVFKDNAPFAPRKSWDAAADKGALYARVRVEPPKGSSLARDASYIHVFNTHLQAHDYDEAFSAQAKQIEELIRFVKNCTKGPDGKYDGRPVVLMGDFNIIANDPEYRLSLAGALKSNPDLILTDVWPKLRSTPGYTWIGSDQKTTEESPWWMLGNVLAGEKGTGQRLDYFFYNEGKGTVALAPKAVSLVPSGANKLYCLDTTSGKDLWWGCPKMRVPKPTDTLRVGDVFGLRVDGTLLGLTEAMWDDFAREWVAQEGNGQTTACSGRYTIFIPYSKPGEFVWAEVTKILGPYVATKTRQIPDVGSKCVFATHTLSDHLGLEMTAEVRWSP